MLQGMTPAPWQDSLPSAHSIRGPHQPQRQFEDSLSAGSRDTPGKERRRASALAEATSARSVKSDPDGALFHAAQRAAITARRADNLKLDKEHEGDPEFTDSQLRRWATAPPSRKVVHSFVKGLVILLLASVAVLVVSTWYPALARVLALH